MGTHDIVLLDEQQLYLDTFQAALRTIPALNVVGATTDSRQAYRLLEETQAGLLISDILLRDTDGVSVARELRRRRLPAAVLIVASQQNRVFVHEAMEAGIRGYAFKSQPLTEIVEAIGYVVMGTPYLAPELTPAATAAPGIEVQEASTMLGRLSRREQEVFCRIIAGAASRDIARNLAISIKTVETHRSHINRKLNVHSTAQLIRLAALTGMLTGSRPVELAQQSAA